MASDAEAMTLGIQHQQAGQFGQAEAMFRQVLEAQSANKDARFRLALVCRLQGRPGEAISHLQRLLQSDPSSADVRENLALSYRDQATQHSTLGRLAEAVESWQQAIRFKPDTAEFFNSLGMVHHARQAWGPAQDALEQALNLQPRFPAALTNLGMVYLVQRHPDEAMRCFQLSLRLQPADAFVQNALGEALFARGKIVEAGQCFRQALYYRPDFADALGNLARVCWAQERWQETADLLERSLPLKAADAWTLTTLAKVYYFKLRKPAESLHYLRQCLALDPANDRFRFMVEALSGTSTRPRMPAELATLMYDEDAEPWDRLMQQRNHQGPHWLKSALAHEPPPRSLDVLDLGCGTGLCGAEFHDGARSLIGIDLSPKMLEKARARGIYNRLIRDDILKATRKFADRFDLVVASDVVMHLGELKTLFEAVHRALRPGGRFAFTADLHDGPENYHLSPWLAYAHSRAYLRQLAAGPSWLEVTWKDVVFPRESGSHVAGLVVVLSRM
jgi:predicted TPR repeat methyltransferase